MSNMKKSIYIGIGVISAIILLFIGTMWSQINSDKIVKNTYINDINVGNLSRDKAREEIKKVYQLENIEIIHLDKIWDISHKDINLSYDIDQTIENAYNLNKKDGLMENIVQTIKSNFGQKNDLKLEISYSEESLKEILENIAEEINLDVKDATLSVSGSNIVVTDSQSGLSVNIEESLKKIKNEIEKGNLKEELIVTKTQPNVTKEQLQEVNTLLGSYSTKFDSSVAGRSTNIRLAANKSSNILLMPGETFSYNKHTGMRTISNGYKNAPVIVQGVVQEGIGGGVCQVSTTLYNAALYAGLDFIELKNHSIPSTYVEKGRDATVTDSGIDFVFKNNLNYPVYIKNYVSGNTVTCQVYGSSKDKQKIQILTSTDGVSEAPIKKVEDPTILKGTEKELEKGRNGYTVSTYRVYKDASGNVIKKEKVATSYYPKKQGVIAVGTMEPVEEVPPPVENPNPPVQNPSDNNNQPSDDIDNTEKPEGNDQQQ